MPNIIPLNNGDKYMNLFTKTQPRHLDLHKFDRINL